MSTTPGTPTSCAPVRSSQACGTWSALICLPPVQRLSRPRKTDIVPRVTTIAGTPPEGDDEPVEQPAGEADAAGGGEAGSDAELGVACVMRQAEP